MVVRKRRGAVDLDVEPCSVCRGTAIGQHGDLDTSKCVACNGTGDAGYYARKRERDEEYADYMLDRRKGRDL